MSVDIPNVYRQIWVKKTLLTTKRNIYYCIKFIVCGLQDELHHQKSK
jgi:hypothetical protein